LNVIELVLSCTLSVARSTALLVIFICQLSHDITEGLRCCVYSCHASLTYLALCWCWNITDTGLDIIISNCR